MATDVATKVAEQARKWERLNELLRDPEIYNFLEREFSRNGTSLAAPSHAPSTAVNSNGYKKGDLVKAVAKTCEESFGSSQFTIYDVIKKMRATGFVFAAKNPDVAANGALRRLVKKEKVKIVIPGTGRRAAQYRWIVGS